MDCRADLANERDGHSGDACSDRPDGGDRRQRFAYLLIRLLRIGRRCGAKFRLRLCLAINQRLTQRGAGSLVAVISCLHRAAIDERRHVHGFLTHGLRQSDIELGILRNVVQFQGVQTQPGQLVRQRHDVGVRLAAVRTCFGPEEIEIDVGDPALVETVPGGLVTGIN